MLLLMYSKIWKQSTLAISFYFSICKFWSSILSSSSVDLILMARYKSMMASLTQEMSVDSSLSHST